MTQRDDHTQESTPPAPPTAEYEAALPHPGPLAAEQFMPVLPPGHFAAFLDEVTRELPLVEDEAARGGLTTRARVLRLNVEQYRVNYEVARSHLTRVLAETGAGVRGAWARQEEHLRFMNAASGGVERDYAEATGAIERAREERFDVLALHGARPDTQSAEGFYQQQALADLAREGHPIRPPERQTGSKRVVGGFATFSKFFVGLISGVSINLLFNPESRLYLTVIALTAGVMFSVLLLWLVDELAYRAKLAGGTPGMGRPIGYIVGIVAVSLLYLGVEGYLNWDGILRVTQQIAANAAQEGTRMQCRSTGRCSPSRSRSWGWPPPPRFSRGVNGPAGCWNKNASPPGWPRSRRAGSTPGPPARPMPWPTWRPPATDSPRRAT